MNGINLTVAYDKYFWVLKNVVLHRGLRIKVYSKRNISQVTKIILKRNDFIVIKTINDTFYKRASFNVLSKFVLRTSKLILTVMSLPSRRMLKFVFSFNFLSMQLLQTRCKSLVKKHLIGISSRKGSQTLSRGSSCIFFLFCRCFLAISQPLNCYVTQTQRPCIILFLP